MTHRATRAPWLALALLAALTCVAAAPHRDPRLVFVERQPPRGDARDQIPGLGPHGRALATGGRLRVRESDGRVHALVDDRRFFDVSDPDVSWDGRCVVFAATVAPDSAWRLWIVGANGGALSQLTRDPTPHADLASPRVDDLDPCWLPDGRVCFASTRFLQVDERGGARVTNLFAIAADGSGLVRLTSDRNGAESPSVDPATGRIVYARWWLNRYRASDDSPLGLTVDFARALPADTVNLWQAVSVTADGDGVRLAAGDPRLRAAQSAYAPIVLRDGTAIGVVAEHSSLDPAPGRTRVVAYRGGIGPGRTLAPRSAVGSACAPAPLPDGRVVYALDRTGRGEFGLVISDADGAHARTVYARPGVLALDPAALAPRRRPPLPRPLLGAPPNDVPIGDAAYLHDLVHTFRFDCLNVFTNAAVDAPIPDAPRLQRDVRIRFFAALARPGVPGGDSVVLVRELPVTRAGAVHVEDMPADVPMFEQLVDAHGHVLRSAMGPAHVPGYNVNRFGSGTKCVGCHAGHSTIPVPVSAALGQWLNAAPSAEVTASSVAPGTSGAHAAVDRRAKGPIKEVAWISAAAADQWVRLAWPWPIEVGAVVLYALPRQSEPRTDLAIQRTEVALFRDGREVARVPVTRVLDPAGTRIEMPATRVDAIEVRPLRATGRVLGRAAVALAEIEITARMADN